MKFYARRMHRWTFVHVLPELTVSFEGNPERDIYVYAGWLFWGVELAFCFCRQNQ